MSVPHPLRILQDPDPHTAPRCAKDTTERSEARRNKERSMGAACFHYPVERYHRRLPIDRQQHCTIQTRAKIKKRQPMSLRSSIRPLT